MHICCLSSLHNLPFFNQLPIYWTPLMTLSPFLFSPVPDSLPPVPPPCPEMLRRPPVSGSFVLCRNLISSNFGRLQGPTRIPLRGWRWRTTWGRRARQSRTIPRSQCGCPTVSCPELFTPKDWLLSPSLSSQQGGGRLLRGHCRGGDQVWHLHCRQEAYRQRQGRNLKLYISRRESDRRYFRARTRCTRLTQCK